jgi:type IV pilus assembly protein PilY1
MKHKSFLGSVTRHFFLFAQTALVSASAWGLPAIPVFLKETVPPNILLTLDDSGSMAWGYVPDSLSALGTTAAPTLRFLAANVNPIQYDPTEKYEAPPKADGTRFTTSFTSAYLDGFRPGAGTVNLSTTYRPTITYTAGNTTQTFTTGSTNQAAYYYVFDAALGTCVAANVNSDSCYRKVVVTATSGPGNTDERQNFANWYSFYRVRHLLMKSSLLIAMIDADPNLRVAWQSLNSCNTGFTRTTGSTICTDVENNAYLNAMNTLDSAHRTRLFGWVSKLRSANGTPLRSAFVRAGDYYKLTTSESPWRDTLGTSSAQNVCRLSYHVALTDGVWNTDSISVGNIDNSTQSTNPSARTYSPMAPYRDSNSNSVADLAFSHWYTDLQPMADQSPVYSATGNTQPVASWTNAEYWDPRNDPATWQHLVTFTIGLGLSTSLTNPPYLGSAFASNVAGQGYQQLASGAASWPATGADAIPGNVYDLWHAAINGRGDFFSAESPRDVYKAFQTILGRISGRSGSAGTAATTSGFVLSNTAIYQSAFSTTGWNGEVFSKQINLDGSIGVERWNTNDTLTNANWQTRNLFGRQLKTAALPNPPVIPFNWSSMNTDTRSALQSENVTKWLRGDPSFERDNAACTAGCVYRRRAKLLGDVLGSAPVLSSIEDFGYKSAPWPGGGDIYRNYLTAKAARTPVLLVGANDGFVHGLNANDGSELFGYSPGELVSNLWRLSEDPYVKRAYVDGPITIGDAYLGAAWKTIAVGTLGAGGKSVYALDITNPTTFSASAVKWEFTHADLGNVLSKPVITRLPNGSWVVIFSGGYENTANRAALFTVNLDTGALLSVNVMTPTVDSCGVSSTGISNGLGAVRAHYTKDGNFYVYGGDLLGYMWRFEFDSNTGGLKTSYSGAPLFKACNAVPARQPITAAPNVVAFGASPIVYFGTGSLFNTGDTSVTTINSFYAVIDDGVAYTQNRGTLLGTQSVTTSGNARVVSANDVNLVTRRGWYIDLPATRERIISTPTLLDERVVFNTFVPDPSSCESTGESWTFLLDALTGGRLDSPVFDLNNDGKFDNADKITGVSPSARRVNGTVGGVTALRTADAPRAGRSRTASGCGIGQIKLISSNVYDRGTSENCTPGATYRSGWRQLR